MNLLKIISNKNQTKLKNYKLINKEDLFMFEIGMSICILNKKNYSFSNIGKLLNFDDFFIITEYGNKKKIINMDDYYIFAKNIENKSSFASQMKYLYDGLVDQSIIVTKLP